MTTHNRPDIGRRPFLRGAGVTLAALGGMTGSAVAKGRGEGGLTPLTDRAADILIYWSQVDDNSNDPDDPGDFGFPDHQPSLDGGLMIPTHDPAGGGLFDFGRIEMTPSGKTLQNRWMLLGGAVMASKPKPYILLHQGDGLYESRGQVMNFKARSADQIRTILELPELPSALAMLAGGKWHAVGSEVAQLGLDDSGDPDPTLPEWGATRIDFYQQKSMAYELSLLYVIVADESADNYFDGLMKSPQTQGAAGSLIIGGRLSPGGQ